MNDSPLRIVPLATAPPDQAAEATATPAAENPDAPTELHELRRLLIEPEQVQLQNVLERLNNPRARAREQSRTLPEAVRLRNAQDDALQEALAPTVVKAFHNSVKQDPRPLAEAIAPLLGPAIRRAIAVALTGLIQSFDRTLQHSLSAQGMKWRVEAWRTGQPFAEVVLRHTLVYRVEQVFLIHKQSGLLLQHVAAKTVAAQDADIVSGMMTAMQEALGKFARDSFGAMPETPIDTLALGDREVWFEPGSDAVLAVVVRGHAPDNLRSDFFAPTIEAIHLEQREALEHYDGDSAPFSLARPHLEACLQSQFQDGSETVVEPAGFKVPRYIQIGTVLLLAAIVTWSFFAWRESSRWQAYLDRLKTEPGIVITETGLQDGKRYVAGLRDPLAIDPDAVLRQETKLDPNLIVARWEPYQALTPQFILARAQTLLSPPPGVTLKFDNGVLAAVGAAPSQWSADARRFARALPGVTAFDERQLVNEDAAQAQAQIERTIIRFNTGTAQLLGGQQATLRSLSTAIQKLLAHNTARLAPQIEIIGHTDAEGDESANLELSQRRAARVAALLKAQGVAESSLLLTGVGAQQPMRADTNLVDKQLNRSVSFKVTQPAQEQR
jgi:outer membrane protein OmpA-like peptidoglycan-associated protein